MSDPIRMTHAPQTPQPGVGPPGVPQVTRMAAPDTSVWNDVVGGSIDSVRQEVDDAFEDMKTCHQNEPDWCMRIISGHSARLSELRGRVQRIEDYAPGWTQLRTREVEPALRELERQYENASRRHTMREFDWKMEQGER